MCVLYSTPVTARNCDSITLMSALVVSDNADDDDDDDDIIMIMIIIIIIVSFA